MCWDFWGARTKHCSAYPGHSLTGGWGEAEESYWVLNSVVKLRDKIPVAVVMYDASRFLTF